MGHILKNKQKVCLFREIIRLFITKTKIRVKNGSHKYDINRPRSRHGHKCTKYKSCLSMIMVLCIKQHSSNI